MDAHYVPSYVPSYASPLPCVPWPYLAVLPPCPMSRWPLPKKLPRSNHHRFSGQETHEKSPFIGEAGLRLPARHRLLNTNHPSHVLLGLREHAPQPIYGDARSSEIPRTHHHHRQDSCSSASFAATSDSCAVRDSLTLNWCPCSCSKRAHCNSNSAWGNARWGARDIHGITGVDLG